MKHWARKLLGIMLCTVALMLICGAAAEEITVDGITYKTDPSTGTATVLNDDGLTKSNTKIVIPDTVSDNQGNQYTVTSIGWRAFDKNKYMEQLTISANIKTIGEMAFYGCSELYKLTFKDGSQLAEIGNEAFNSCVYLSTIKIPATVSSIGRGAFQNTNIAPVTIPASVKTIGVMAFESPYVTFLSSGTSTECAIEKNAFHLNKKLTIKQTNDGLGTTQLTYEYNDEGPTPDLFGTLSYKPVAGYDLSSVTVKIDDKDLEVTNNQFDMSDCQNGGVLTIDAKFAAIPAQAPIINTQPSNLNLTYGYTTGNTLMVSATAADDTTYKALEYQWYSCDDTSKKNPQAISTGGTSSTYTVPTGENAGTKYYYCDVTATRKDNDATETASSNVATVTISKASVTVKVNEQTYEYTGMQRGEGDTAYDDTAVIATKVDVDGLISSDTITSIVLDGSETNVGVYPNRVELTGIAIGQDGILNDNYEITRVAGTLTITAPKMAITVNGDNDTMEYNGKEQTYSGTVIATSTDAAFDASKFSYKGSVAVKGKDVSVYTTQLNKDDCVYSDKNYTGDWTIGTPISLEITPKSITGATVLLDKTQLTYNGSEQTVNVTGVTIDGLSLTSNDYEVTGNKGKDKDTYTVTVTGKGNYKDSATAEWSIVAKTMTVSAAGFTGVYDGQPHGITVSVTDPVSGAEIKYGKTAGTYDLDDSPTLTNIGTMTVYYKVTAANYTDYTGSAMVTIMKKTAAVVTTAPKAKTGLVASGYAQELVQAGTASGGTIQYALGSNKTTAPTSGWNVAIATGTNAGTYYVWYKAVGDADHTDSTADCVTVTINPLKNGLYLDDDGVWRYYENGVFVEKTGIVEFEGGQFFVANGILCSDANGLALFNEQWYFLANGQIQLQYTGLALYDGEWFYIVNGLLNTKQNGLVDYNGSKFIVAVGRIVRGVNGLWQNTDGVWYYMADGQVVTYYTGLVQYDGAWFYVINGRLATEFTGDVEYNGAIFHVVGGQVVN